MKRMLVLMLIIISFSGCRWFRQEEPAIEIGDIKVGAKEFEDVFNSSSFARKDISAKKKFLDTFISRKLILREAEKKGLDKDPEFLKDIQLFWEQSLLKLMLSQKTKELSGNITVTDKETNDYYLIHKDKEFQGKGLSEVYDGIKWLLFNRKQKEALQEWINSLKEKTKISIDYDTLGINSNE